MKRFVAVLALCLCLPFAASATPPQIVAVSETLIGVDDTHIFVLRELSDNMGRYQPTQTDMVLIARNRETNRDDQTWVVLRTLDHGADEGLQNLGGEERLEVLPLAERVNPFDVLLWRKARPMMTRGMPAEVFVHGNRGRVEIGGDAVVVTAREGEVFRLSTEALPMAIRRSLNATRDALPPHFAEGGVDRLRDITFGPEALCTFDRFVSEVDTGYKPHWIAYVTCVDEDWAQYVGMFLTLPQAAP